MEQSLSKWQRSDLFVGFIGILHCSVVPPLAPGGLFHEFAEMVWR